MRGTVYGKLPRGTQMKKALGTTALDVLTALLSSAQLIFT